MFEKNVARGARWLDKNYPGWWKKIKLPTLDLRHCTKCVIGQVFGDYCDAELPARPTEKQWSRSHGFSINPMRYAAEDYDVLTAAWKSLITDRRGKGK